MTDQPTLYQVDAEPDIADWLVETQVLVSVERCEHGRIDPHYTAWPQDSINWCPGSPTLRSDDAKDDV